MILAVLGLIGAGILSFVHPIVAIGLLAFVTGVAIWLAWRRLSLSGIAGWAVLAGPLIGIGGLGWLGAEYIFGLAGARTPAPSAAITDPMDSTQRAAVLDYASHLEFAEDSIEYHGQFDQNLIDTLGTVAIVSPEKHIHRTRKSDIRRGRIQLKITIMPRPGRPATERYDSLTPGVTYVWVDSLVMLTRALGTARAVYVPEDPAVPAWRRTIALYRTKRWNQAVARWSPAQCWVCEKSGWCH
ncbi:MAG: hypothetical protein ACREMW_10540 [Gemmatimonadales bacterium]